MRVGILGGTFNPIHDVHLMIGQKAKDDLALDRVYFMPSSVPAHKQTPDLLSFEDRFQMTTLAVNERLGGEKNGFFVSDIENKRDGNTYTFETLQILNDKHPDDKLFFIIGADSLMYFEKWKRPDRISELSSLVVFGRPGFSQTELIAKAEELRKAFGTEVIFLQNKEYDYSSTEVRNEIRIGKLWSTHLPSLVKEYIFKKDLYERERGIQSFSPDLIQSITKEMMNTLSDYRFFHTIGVAHMATNLAYVYGVSADKAMIAGLLHDCAKEIPKNEQERLCDEYGVELTPMERKIKQLIHGRLGAYFVKSKYHIDDEEVIRAVSNHTSGRPNMSLLEQIIFCADFLEPERDYYCEPSLNVLRKEIYTDIDDVTVKILENQFRFFKDMNREVDPYIYEVYDFYKQKISDRNNLQ